MCRARTATSSSCCTSVNLQTKRRVSSHHVHVSCLSLRLSVQVEATSGRDIKIEIIGISRASGGETHLDANVNGQVDTLIVASELLATATGVSLEENIQDKVLQKIPFMAVVKIQGGKITEMTLMS